MAEADVKCFFCQGTSKYSCPQCLVRYCSVVCYQSKPHQACSEHFYKQQVMKELKQMKGSDAEKRKLMEMLSRLNQNNDEETLETAGICERLSNISLDDVDAIWEKLTDKEKENFQRRVQSGNLDFIKIWTPWWTGKSHKVQEVNKNTKKKSGLPKLLKELPQVKDILHNKKPDDNLKYCVLEVLLAYTYLMRLFNGDFYDSPDEVVEVLCQLSKVLCENKVYSDVETCLFRFIENVKATDGATIDPVSMCFEDLILILRSLDNFVERALSDLYSFLKRYRRHIVKLNTDQSDSDVNNIDQSKFLFEMSKKVYFFLVYGQECKHLITSLCESISNIKARLLHDRELHEQTKTVVECNIDRLKSRDGKLIKEI